jgi:hypothetical protein
MEFEYTHSMISGWGGWREEADCDTDHYMVVEKIRESLAVINKWQQHRGLMWE